MPTLTYIFNPNQKVWVVDIVKNSIFSGICIEIKAKIYNLNQETTDLYYSILLDDNRGNFEYIEEHVFNTFDEASVYLQNRFITPTPSMLVVTPTPSRLVLPNNSLFNSLISYYSLDQTSSIKLDAISSNNLYSYAGGIENDKIDYVKGSSAYKNTIYKTYTGLITNSSDIFNFDDSFAITCWMRTPEVANAIVSLGKFNTNLQKGYAISTIYDPEILGHKVYVQFGDGATSQIVIDDFDDLLDNHWHFIALNYDKNTNQCLLFVNGSHVTASVPLDINESTRFMLFGKGFDETLNYQFSSSSIGTEIDEVGIFNRVLSLNELNFLYDSGYGRDLNEILAYNDNFIITHTPTPTSTLTPTPSVTSTLTPTPTITSTLSATPSVTATVTPTPTTTPSIGASATPTPTNTPTPSITPSVTNTSTITPAVTNTPTPTPTSSITPTPTMTPTITPTTSAGSFYGIFDSNSTNSDNTTLTNSNMTATFQYTNSWANARCNIRKTSGKYYFGYQIQQRGLQNAVGICAANFNLSNVLGTGKSWAVRSDGYIYANGVLTYNDILYQRTLITPYVIGVAIDLDTGALWFSANGVWISGDPTTNSQPLFTGVKGNIYPVAGALTDVSPAVINLRTHFLTYPTPDSFIPGWFL